MKIFEAEFNTRTCFRNKEVLMGPILKIRIHDYKDFIASASSKVSLCSQDPMSVLLSDSNTLASANWHSASHTDF